MYSILPSYENIMIVKRLKKKIILLSGKFHFPGFKFSPERAKKSGHTKGKVYGINKSKFWFYQNKFTLFSCNPQRSDSFGLISAADIIFYTFKTRTAYPL